VQMRTRRRVLGLGLFVLIMASLLVLLVVRDNSTRPHGRPHSQATKTHVYPAQFATAWTAWCAKRVDEAWCRCAMRRAQEIYDFNEFNTPQTDWSPFFRACGDQDPAARPPTIPGG
jgi:hypothetical protein